MVKRFHSGRAAQSGVYSAQLASDGFTGILDVLEASYGGYLSSYSEAPNAARLTDDLGSVWETGKIGYKPHASVTSIHAALDALVHLMKTHTFKPEDIAQVKVGVSHMTYVHCAWDYKAQGVTAAQMNLYYGLAVVAYDGVAFVRQYREDRLTDPKLLDFITRIDAYDDSEINAMGAAFRHAARVSVTTRSGATHSHEILNRRGSPENPLSAGDVEYKFRNVVESCLSPSQINHVVDLVDEMDKKNNLSELISLLAAQRQV